MNELHLFAGCGGGVLGGRLLGHRQIGYVEREPYRCRTLAQRIKDGILCDAPIYCGTVREFIDTGCAATYTGLVDVLCAGFPCPPFSLAGKRLADKDPRNAWPETRDAIEVIKPRFCFLENVPGLVTSPYLETIRVDLRCLGYSMRATVIGGIDLGAPHIRKRLWMLAYPDHMGRQEYARPSAVRPQHPPPKRMCSISNSGESFSEPRPEQLRREAGAEFNQCSARPDMADTERARFDGTAGTGLCSEGQPLQAARPAIGGNGNVPNAAMPGCSDGGQVQAGSEQPGRDSSTGCGLWDAEPRLGRVADGVADRVDRLEAIGDGQIPIVAASAFRVLSRGLI